MTEFVDKFMAFSIIDGMIDDLITEIYQALKYTSDENNRNSASYWRQPHIWTLSNLESRAKEMKRITRLFMRKLERRRNHEVSH